jgi:hypothetical protein
MNSFALIFVPKIICGLIIRKKFKNILVIPGRI